jgi:glycosyltransferase involved in cell wall biosynthesis
MILAVNTSFPELDQLAASLAEAGLLSTYVRPYANLQRSWERRLANWPGLGQAYARSLGRRKMPEPLSAAHLREAGVMMDFLMATHSRLPSSSFAYQAVRKSTMHARTHAVAQTAAKILADERAVIASWGCAEPVFRKAKAKGALCVLNYSSTHHRFTRRYLLDEAKLQPAFAGTLTDHNRSARQEARFDAEIALADKVLVGSSFARESFIAEGVPSEKVIAIPYGTDIHMFEPATSVARPNGNLRLLFVGRLGQGKGLSYLLEAARRLEGVGVSLTMVGQTPPNCHALAPYRHLFRHVPHVPRAELRELYRQADVFVFPTLYEGMGLVVLEAMASGLPVITTPNGPGDVVRDGVDGFLVPPRDLGAIVDRMERLRADPELRAEMGRNARQRAQEFTWAAYRQAAVTQLQNWLEGIEPL